MQRKEFSRERPKHGSNRIVAGLLALTVEAALLVAWSAPAARAAVPPTMSYQGVLKDAVGQPLPDGNHSLSFGIYSQATGGTVLWQETQVLPVTGGLFNAILGSVHPLNLAFDGPYWLQTEVDGVALTPRTQLASSPYAMRALVAESVVGGSGIGGGGTPGKVPKFTGATTVGNSLIADDGSGVSINGTAVIGTPSASKATKPGDPNGAGARGIPQLSVYGPGQVVVATLNEPDANEDYRAAIFGYRTRAVANDGSSLSVYGTNNAVLGYNFWGDQYTFGVAGYSYNDFTRTGGVLGSDVGGNYWTALGYRDEFERTWGLYTPSPSYLGGDVTVDGRIRMSKDYGANLGGVAIKAENTNAAGIALWAVTHGNDASVVVTQNGTGDIIRGFSPTGLSFRVTNTGRVVAPVVEITGGSDLAEPFAVSGNDEIPDGALVVIDDRNAGQLKLSDRPYDQRVAGVVSGAGGVHPGLTLSQADHFAGDKNVALNGRVYALADAGGGPIRPGDLLTTSGRPGHAMKATDPDRSHGAVIGKAMSSLDEGCGLVLVLVNLQ